MFDILRWVVGAVYFGLMIVATIVYVEKCFAEFTTQEIKTKVMIVLSYGVFAYVSDLGIDTIEKGMVFEGIMILVVMLFCAVVIPIAGCEKML